MRLIPVWFSLVLAGCGPSAGTGPTTAVETGPGVAVGAAVRTNALVAPTAVAVGEETAVVLHQMRAQTNLPQVKLYVGAHEITSDLCATVTQVATGLMWREGIGAEETMFFVFGSPQQRSFYMKNVPFPISAGYIDSEGVLQEIVQLKAMDPTPVPSRSDRIQFVLEAAPDWFERKGVAVGTLLTTPDGPLKGLVRRAQLP